MKLARFFSLASAWTMLALFLAACSAAQPSAAPVRALPSPSPVIPTPTAAPVVTEAEEKEAWDLVIMGDSTLWGVGEYFAEYIEEDLGVTVDLHDLWKGSLSAVRLLEYLENDEEYRSAVRNAEVVVYFGNPIGSATGDWECISPIYYVNDCSPETFEGYTEVLEAIVDEILTLRDGAPTVIRATDFYIPILGNWRKAGIQEACTGCIATMNDAVHQAAAAHNVPVAGVFEAFNGPAHDEDPRDKGYIGRDGIHASEQGRQVIANLLLDLGYEAVKP